MKLHDPLKHWESFKENPCPEGIYAFIKVKGLAIRSQQYVVFSRQTMISTMRNTG